MEMTEGMRRGGEGNEARGRNKSCHQPPALARGRRPWMKARVCSEGDGTGHDRTGQNGERARMPSDGNKEEEEGDGEVIILCSTDVERVVPGVRRDENSPKTRHVEQRVPSVLGAPNVGRNALSHSVPSRPTYQTVTKVPKKKNSEEGRIVGDCRRNIKRKVTLRP
ncbi:hypothetical protein C1H46_028046 [Malus baccata]|uniref:Uncharacterized protein n=1 Tax=Malus baccata TaxID=106549 RepID=A0A540LIS9_MALBA|nr:hypothetical protein C1H46_028046 [Malus baccata]